MKRVLIASFICSLFLLASVVTVQAFSVSRPFGGIVMPFPLSFPCTCSPTGVYYLTFGPPSYKTLTYQVGIQKYANFTMNTLPIGKNVLGYYNPANTTACKIYVGTSCSIVASAGAITSTVGSSF